MGSIFRQCNPRRDFVRICMLEFDPSLTITRNSLKENFKEKCLETFSFLFALHNFARLPL